MDKKDLKDMKVMGGSKVSEVTLDQYIAQTQRMMTVCYFVLFAIVLSALIWLPRPLDDSTKTLLITLAGILGTLVTMQNQFWFARQRTAGVPDPSSVGPVGNVERMNVSQTVAAPVAKDTE